MDKKITSDNYRYLQFPAIINNFLSFPELQAEIIKFSVGSSVNVLVNYPDDHPSSS